jgi:hypothetical protein
VTPRTAQVIVVHAPLLVELPLDAAAVAGHARGQLTSRHFMRLLAAGSVEHTGLCWRQAGQTASFAHAVASAQHAPFMHASQTSTPVDTPQPSTPLPDDELPEVGHPELELLEAAAPDELLEGAPPEPLLFEVAPPEPLPLEVAPLDEEAPPEPAADVPALVAKPFALQPAARMTNVQAQARRMRTTLQRTAPERSAKGPARAALISRAAPARRR